MMTRPSLRISVRPSSTRPLMLAMVLLTAGITARAGAAGQPIDTEQSAITVHVFSGGLFAGLGDNHEIHGAVKRGMINDANPAEVHIVVDAASFRVLDPGASAKNRAAVQMRMLGPDVLDVNRFPEILFDSESAERSESGGWTVRGQLTLHGQTRPLTTTVNSAHGHYKGSLALKQSDFGIAPIKVAGGAVKVKDQLTIDFDIVARAGVDRRTE
jgi:polyisoprenoid-binding protein YceI